MRPTADTKERIERAALRMFAKQGVAASSIREIARSAGVSQGAMYVHYASKEELAWALFARGWAEIALELRRLARQRQTFREQLRAMARYVFELFDKDWEFVTYVYLSRHENLRRVTADLPNPHLVVRLLIVEAMGRGEIPRQDAEVATAMVMGALIQIIDTKILGRIKPRLTTLADSVADSCVRMLGG